MAGRSSSYPRLGRGHHRDESRREAQVICPPATRIRRNGCRRRHPARCQPDLRHRVGRGALAPAQRRVQGAEKMTLLPGEKVSGSNTPPRIGDGSFEASRSPFGVRIDVHLSSRKSSEPMVWLAKDWRGSSKCRCLRDCAESLFRRVLLNSSRGPGFRRWRALDQWRGEPLLRRRVNRPACQIAYSVASVLG